MFYYILSESEILPVLCGFVLIFAYELSYCLIVKYEYLVNIVKNRTNCISPRYNCNPLSVNPRQTVQTRTQSDALSPRIRIQAENRMDNIANSARCAGNIGRIVLKSAQRALIVIKTAENEVN